jgi:hypothetical protein
MKERRLTMFENRVLRSIFGTNRDEVTGEWRKLRYMEHNDLESSPNTIWMMKSIMRWAGHGELWGRGEGHQDFGGETRGKETTWKIQV